MRQWAQGSWAAGNGVVNCTNIDKNETERAGAEEREKSKEKY